MSRKLSLIYARPIAFIAFCVCAFAGAQHARAVPFLGYEFQLNGAATITGDALHLTRDAVVNDRGSAFITTPFLLGPAMSLTVAFKLKILGGTEGADGVAVVFHNDPRGASFLGLEGGNIGFYTARGPDGNPLPFGPAIAISFDTYRNADYGDANDNHVGILLSSTYQVQEQVPAPVDLNGASDFYFVWVEYGGLSDAMSVYLSRDPAKPDTPLLEYPIDLAAFLGGQAFIGFTAASGGLTNEPVIEPRHDPVTVSAPSTVLLLALGIASLLWSGGFARCRALQ